MICFQRHIYFNNLYVMYWKERQNRVCIWPLLIWFVAQPLYFQSRRTFYKSFRNVNICQHNSNIAEATLLISSQYMINSPRSYWTESCNCQLVKSSHLYWPYIFQIISLRTTLRLIINVSHFTDDIFKIHFLDFNSSFTDFFWPEGPIDNTYA